MRLAVHGLQTGDYGYTHRGCPGQLASATGPVPASWGRAGLDLACHRRRPGQLHPWPGLAALAAAPRSLPGSAGSMCCSWAMRSRTAARSGRSYGQAAGHCSRNRARTALGAQALQAARRCVTQGLRAAGQRLRCTTRVIRCRTRLICQRHRGSTRPGPRPRPASSGAPAPTAVYWLIHCLVDASPRGAAAPAWSSLRGSRCTLGRNPLRTQEHRRCGRGGCGLPAATSIAQCSFLPMGNALPSGTPEKHARRQSAADAR
jgi:hypothetical protein